ncbi:MAG: hypothetical protein RH948_05965 [Cyclobacteriaceae bacterium]
MKLKITAISILFFITWPLMAQEDVLDKYQFSPAELTEIETAVNLYWKWDSDDEPRLAVKRLT